MALVIRAAPKEPAGKLLEGVPNDFGSVEAFGQLFFTQGLVPFELSSALLMVAIIGSIAVARGRNKHEMAAKTEVES
jgi:NADH-quinone oxidoreductase subunit J